MVNGYFLETVVARAFDKIEFVEFVADALLAADEIATAGRDHCVFH
jgi:hypothetical protein